LIVTDVRRLRGSRGRIQKVQHALRWFVLATVALATIGCDRATKHAATVLLAGEPNRSYLADTVRLDYVENTGGFLSLGADLPRPARTVVFTIATGFALLALFAMGVRDRFAGPSSLGLVVFVAGGTSNWIDRVARGSVVDFLNVGIGPLRTGVFNVADIAIMVGAGLIALGATRRSSRRGPHGAPMHDTR
jgi:signal peptidase II